MPGVAVICCQIDLLCASGWVMLIKFSELAHFLGLYPQAAEFILLPRLLQPGIGYTSMLTRRIPHLITTLVAGVLTTRTAAMSAASFHSITAQSMKPHPCTCAYQLSAPYIPGVRAPAALPRLTRSIRPCSRPRLGP